MVDQVVRDPALTKKLSVPVPPTKSAFRYYPAALGERIRFVRRAQELGFSLDEVAELLRLEDGADRASIRRIASDRLGQIESKLRDLKRMRKVLSHLVAECEHTRAELPCPIISTLASPPRAASGSPASSAARAPAGLR